MPKRYLSGTILTEGRYARNIHGGAGILQKKFHKSELRYSYHVDGSFTHKPDKPESTTIVDLTSGLRRYMTSRSFRHCDRASMWPALTTFWLVLRPFITPRSCRCPLTNIGGRPVLLAMRNCMARSSQFRDLSTRSRIDWGITFV